MRFIRTGLNGYVVWAINRFAFFRRVDVYFGKPISFDELSYDPSASGEYARVTKVIFDRVCDLYDLAVAEENARVGK